MAVEFKIARHLTRDVDIVEVWIDGRMMATIYPDGTDKGITVISRYIDDITRSSPGDVKMFSFTFRKELVQ